MNNNFSVKYLFPCTNCALENIQQNVFKDITIMFVGVVADILLWLLILIIIIIIGIPLLTFLIIIVILAILLVLIILIILTFLTIIIIIFLTFVTALTFGTPIWILLGCFLCYDAIANKQFFGKKL